MNPKNSIRVLLGAAVGELLGYVLLFAVARHSFYEVALPGGLLGLGAGIFKTPSKAVPILCGLLALVPGLFTQWCYAPFAADASLGYFVLPTHRLRPLTVIMIAVGTLIGFWVPFRRGQAARKARSFDETPEAKTMEK